MPGEVSAGGDDGEVCPGRDDVPLRADTTGADQHDIGEFPDHAEDPTVQTARQRA